MAADRQALSEMWPWLVGIGVAWIVLGALALLFLGLTTVMAVAAVGVLLIIAGIAEIVHSFAAQRWGGLLWHLMVGLLAGVLGLMLFLNPTAGALALTLLAAAYLLLAGAFRIVGALVQRYPKWDWAVLGGIISLLLGVFIWVQWPVSGLWAIGLFIGIDMILNGGAMIGEGMSARNINQAGGTPAQQPGETTDESEHRRAA
jgi:uncharacterized membrane protein HdeD (DUF308 family)